MKMRKLTPLMIQQLRVCKQMMQDNVPCSHKHFPSTLKGLVKRGIIEVVKDTKDQKIFMAVKLTPFAEEVIQDL